MKYKSEIRLSTIDGLLDKAAKKNYGKYLSRLILKQVRGFKDEPISFDFPITALIGPNGGGKTTILGAAGCAYKSIQPRRFFAKSGMYDEGMQGWALEYEIIDRDMNKKDIVRRTASFKNLKWNRDALERNVLLFGVSRTTPIIERAEFSWCASKRFTVPENQIQEFNDNVAQSASRILGKNISNFKQLLVDQNKNITLLTGKTNQGKGYSEFHFGAGESSVIRMVAEIELATENSLILIEEIENGLHPVAAIKMVEYLIEVAERKKIQAIFTTHSNDALEPLPSKAIWVAIQNRVFQGKLDIQSLRAITGQIEAKLAIFVEDAFAKTWVEAMLRQNNSIAIDNIEIHGMEGDGTAVAMNKHHNQDPSVSFPSVCVIDGDSRQTENKDDRVFRLPGGIPEEYIFDEVIARWNEIGGKLSVALLQKFENSTSVYEVCVNVKLNNRDPHLLFAQIGEKIGLIPPSSVAMAFTNIWAQVYPENANLFLSKFEQFLPKIHVKQDRVSETN